MNNENHFQRMSLCKTSVVADRKVACLLVYPSLTTAKTPIYNYDRRTFHLKVTNSQNSSHIFLITTSVLEIKMWHTLRVKVWCKKYKNKKYFCLISLEVTTRRTYLDLDLVAIFSFLENNGIDIKILADTDKLIIMFILCLISDKYQNTK